MVTYSSAFQKEMRCLACYHGWQISCAVFLIPCFKSHLMSSRYFVGWDLLLEGTKVPRKIGKSWAEITAIPCTLWPTPSIHGVLFRGCRRIRRVAGLNDPWRDGRRRDGRRNGWIAGDSRQKKYEHMHWRHSHMCLDCGAFKA